jgi:GT2 family glycosyltransferase
MMTIAVLITCHNRKQKTVNCLNLLLKQVGINELFKIDVYLVDDGCTDGTPAAVNEKFPQVNIIKGNGNLYWNRGMHLAWKNAASNKNYHFYLWLNDDTFLYENAMIELLNASNVKLNKSVIVGSTYSPSLKTCSYGGCNKKNKLLSPNNNLQEVYIFNGNIVLIPTYVFSIVGLLDDFYPHAIGDFEYSLRVRKFNLESYIAPQFIGVCEGSDVLPLWCSSTNTLLTRIRNYIIKK